MDNMVWGIVILISGIFIASYGSVLFRFALAFLGFAIGYSLVMWLGGGLDEVLRIVVGVVAGGIVAAIFYFAVKFTLYIAGGLVGLVIMLALLGLFEMAGLDLGAFGWILAVAAAGIGGFFGHRLGGIITILASSLGGAYLVVLALAALFVPTIDTDNPLEMLGAGFPLVLFLTIAVISFLAQYQAFTVRRRFLR